MLGAADGISLPWGGKLFEFSWGVTSGGPSRHILDNQALLFCPR